MITFIQDFLKLCIPGRRRLSKKHEENRAKAFELQKLLLNQYQSLALLPLVKCHTENLGGWNPEKFAAFLAEPEREREWQEAKAILSQVEIPEMSGGVNPGDQRLIFNLIQHLRPQKILEVGTHIGSSTVHLATALRLLGPHIPGTVTTVDIKDVNDSNLKPWLEFGCPKSPKEMIDLIGAQRLVDFRVSDSVDFLKNSNEKFDFIFLDGNHSAETVYQEVPPRIEVPFEERCDSTTRFLPGNETTLAGRHDREHHFSSVSDSWAISGDSTTSTRKRPNECSPVWRVALAN